ncbi:MAG TPA: PD-(D/E)XK nuclease family protein [Oxalicibacterium sp.]|nr:PD-(D/E)XK nuclease family protein [Oxalicibacterium sp.]
MTQSAIAIPPSSAFWDEAARALLQADVLTDARDLSPVRVLVPTFAHAQSLKAALAAQLGGAFIPPAIGTLSGWLDLLPPAGTPAASASERLMSLYATLREQGWLKKLFGARRNTDLLPLAEILLTLSDELTQAMLPAMQAMPDLADRRWQAALETLTPAARTLLSDETQLVWSIWKSQLDANDAVAIRYRRMQQLAEQPTQPLFWISPVAPDPMEQGFLDAYAAHQAVTVMSLDWRTQAVHPAYAAAWQEILSDAPDADLAPAAVGNLRLYPARTLEDEATAGAQTIIDWLQAGRQHIAIVAQDRVVARRMRALLERAQVMVADETGWKLSTTRAASALVAWFELLAARAETVTLLDFLKSPFVFADIEDKAALVMATEIALRRANVPGEWSAVSEALQAVPDAQRMVAALAQQAKEFVTRKTLCEWIGTTERAIDALGMRAALLADEAGQQMLQLLQTMAQDCRDVSQPFSLAEWRAFISLQLESTAFLQRHHDQRVVMLPLNGARLRSFDAVLLVGADAAHLPSQPAETLFFANAVRRELGLDTRESRQRQQLRDFAELLSSNDEVVLSWQSSRNGEPNALSPWIERLRLTLARSGVAQVDVHQKALAPRRLPSHPPYMPAPSAANLRPARLSASGYNSLVACPYQFFAMRMLGLSGIDELSDLPEKREYGEWLHDILARFHKMLRERTVPAEERAALLQEISDQVFAHSLDRSGAALGYFARWKKTMPAYLEWVAEREAQGWQFQFGEEHLERMLQWEDGEVMLHGYLDRVDENADGERAVLDYKSTGQATLARRLREGEDHQLPFYGLLSDKALANAAYVPLEATRESIREVAAPDFDLWQQSLREQIVHDMRAIDRGAPMPATGPESVCRFCDARGLCRKGAW